MNFLSRHLLGIAIASASLCLSALPANAQRTSFSLPFEAHWSSFVLAPGDYTISFPLTDNGARVIQLTGNGRAVNILVTVREQLPGRGRSYLTLVNVDGSYVVKSLTDSARDRRLNFKVPKALRKEFAKDGNPTETIISATPAHDGHVSQ